jgi:hypothetical protein
MVGRLHAQGADTVKRALRVAEAIEHEVRALARQGLCDAEANAAGGTGDEGSLAFDHGDAPGSFQKL